ncbi:hypothetical protein FI667_g3535, partial [Globisporangium splendens]
MARASPASAFTIPRNQEQAKKNEVKIPSFQVDSDGDVDMSVSHPVFEFITAPRIASWDQSALVKWRRERQQYGRMIREWCGVTDEAYENVLVSVLASVEPRILNDLARYTFEIEVSKLTDGDMLGAGQKKCSSLLNPHAPDVEELFKQQLNMNLRERDIEARIMVYFMDFDLIVEENGLSEVFGCDQLLDAADDYARKKNRCKLLIDSLALAILKTDIKRLPGERKDVKPGERKDAMRKEQVSQNPKQGKRPSLSGCLMCKGSHWVSECPTATDDEILAARADSGDTLAINGLLEVNYCADIGAAFNILPGKVLLELLEADNPLAIVGLKTPVDMKMADGRTITCDKECSVDLQISTAAGQVHIRNVNCLILEGDEEEFLLGNDTLKSMDIDVGQMIEQLAGTSVDGDTGDNIPPEDGIGHGNDEEVRKKNNGKWCCAVVPDRKRGSHDGFRITNDYRPINRLTIPIAGPTPNLAVATKSVKGATRFGSFDLFKGFWQMPLAQESQELFSFMAEDGIYTPTRAPQGAVDSALHFQTQMQEDFSEMLFGSILTWIYTLPCVQHDPDRIQTLRSLPMPVEAANLQYLLCATNWVRDPLIDYARVVAPLQHLLNLVLTSTSRKKRHAESNVIGWGDESTMSYCALIELLANSTKLAFPDSTATVCLCTDASSLGWVVVVTQVEDWNPIAPMPKQAHELLICKSGTFKGAQRFTPVYTPWINGTVERLNRDILHVMRVFGATQSQHAPVASLANKSPIELFTGLKVSTPLDTLLIPDGTATSSSTKSINLDNIDASLTKLRNSLHMTHTQGQVCSFSVGDFVLWLRVDTRLGGNKVMVRLLRPFRVVAALPHSFLIQHLITGDKNEVHGSRLKFYSDSSLNVDEELLEHVSLQGITLGVASIVDHRRNPTSKKWELLISWQRLQSIEDSWEPLNNMLHDVLAKVREYAKVRGARELLHVIPK